MNDLKPAIWCKTQELFNQVLSKFPAQAIGSSSWSIHKERSSIQTKNETLSYGIYTNVHEYSTCDGTYITAEEFLGINKEFQVGDLLEHRNGAIVRYLSESDIIGCFTGECIKRGNSNQRIEAINKYWSKNLCEKLKPSTTTGAFQVGDLVKHQNGIILEVLDLQGNSEQLKGIVRIPKEKPDNTHIPKGKIFDSWVKDVCVKVSNIDYNTTQTETYNFNFGDLVCLKDEPYKAIGVVYSASLDYKATDFVSVIWPNSETKSNNMRAEKLMKMNDMKLSLKIKVDEES